MDNKIYRAVFYGRVSTVNESQDSSIENQLALAERYLDNHPEIVLVEPLGTYVEKVSGKSDCRDKYIEMMARLSKGDVDYVIAKDLKRLSRSTEVSAQLRNACKKYGFKLLLLESGRVYDPNEEANRMLFGFEALVSEEVVFRQSAYGRIAHKQKMESKKLNRLNATFGFRWDYEINDMVIYEKEADIICMLFEKLVFQDLGVKELQNWLKTEGVDVSVNTIRKWLHETAYIGIFHMNKKGSELGVGAGQKTKRFTRPKEEWVAVERPDLKILDTELFELAQKIIDRRNVVYNGKAYSHEMFHGTHLFATKVFCKECGSSYAHYWCNRDKTISAYKDSKKKSEQECPNTEYNRIYESDLIEIALASINGFITEHEACFDVLEKAIIQSLNEGVLENAPQKQLIKQIEKAEKEAERLLESYLETSGALKLALAEKYEKQVEKIEQLKSQIKEDTDDEGDKKALIERIKKIKSRIGQMKKIQELDRETVLRFIKRIEIDKTGKIEVLLNTDALYKSQISAWKDRKQSSEKKAAFLVPSNKVNYEYNICWYRLMIDRMIDGETIFLFKYQYVFKGNRRWSRSFSKYLGTDNLQIEVSVILI